MKIRWLGHAAFAITSNQGTIIIADPFEPNAFRGAVGEVSPPARGYEPIKITADIVTVSHQHADHNGVKSLPGKPQVLDKPQQYQIGDIRINGVKTCHDASGGKERGSNIVFTYELDNLKLAHLGDLGHIPGQEQIKAIGAVDILFVPVGGYFTIDASQASQVVALIKPRITFPMHYKTEMINYPISPVDVFLSGQANVRRVIRWQFEHSELWSTLVGEPRGLPGILGCNSLRSNSRWTNAEVTCTKDTLPEIPEIWVPAYR